MYLGLQVKWNQFSSNNSHHTSCIHKGLHAGKWPDLMTSKPDSVSTLGYHTRRPLEPQVHWDATGTTLSDVSTRWCSSGNPVLICIIGTHWNTTGRPLEDHWKHTGNTLATNNSFPSGIPVYTRVLVPGTLDCHYIATGIPLAQGKGDFIPWKQWSSQYIAYNFAEDILIRNLNICNWCALEHRGWHRCCRMKLFLWNNHY